MSYTKSRWTVRVTVLLASLLAAPGLSIAQELRGQIIGTVLDGTGLALPGVTVTARSATLILPQTTTTEGDGSYRFPALPSGEYTVTFELSQFQTRRQEAVKLSLATILRIDATLQPSSLSSEITVVADSPVVDVSGTSVGTSFDKELLTGIPTARDIWSAMALAPGFQMRGIDVGGSHTGAQTTYSAYGVATGHRTLVEGIIVNNSRTSNSGYFDYGSMEEFRLGASGAMGEAAGPGSMLNFTVKSGENTWGGDLSFDYQNDDMVSDNVPQALKSTGGVAGDGFKAPTGGVSRGNRITSKYDVNVGLRGPIVKDKAHFFIGYRNNDLGRTVIGLPDFEDKSKQTNITAKVNYALSSRNTLIAFANFRTKAEPTRGVSASSPPETTQDQDGKMQLYKLEWTSILNDRLFLDLQAGLHAARNIRGPYQTGTESVEGVPPGRRELTTGQLSGAAATYQSTRDWRPQVTGSLTWSKQGWLGSHQFKTGFQIFKFRNELKRYQSGNDIYYYDRNGVPAEVDIYNTPNTTMNDDLGTGVYLQDAWAVSRRLTLNIGLRFDRYELGWPELSYTPNQAAYFTAATTPAATLVSRNVIAPRIGAAWDFRGSGKSVIKVFAGRFYLDPMDDITADANPVGAAARRFLFTDLNGNRIFDNPAELGRQLSTSGGAGFVRVDPNIKIPYGDELSVHIEGEILKNTSGRASFVYKNLRDQDAEIDLARASAFVTPFTAIDNGPDNVRGTPDDQTMSLFDLRAGTASDRVRTTPGGFMPAFNSDYKTLEFALNRRFQGNWMMLASFSHTWSQEFLAETVGTSADAMAFHAAGYRFNPNQRRFGRQNTTIWDLKLTGRYSLDKLGLSAASTYRVQSGYNYMRSISVTFPVAGSTTIPAEAAVSRAPRVGIWDARLEKSFKVGGNGAKISAVVDVFNILNSDTVVNFRTTSGTRYKEIIALLDPRTVRFGIQGRF